jgi:hypothetical protein
MFPKGADKVGGAKALPIRLVMVATLLALALIASMGWYVWNSVRVLHAVQNTPPARADWVAPRERSRRASAPSDVTGRRGWTVPA